MGYQQGEFVTAVLFGFGAVALVLASFGLFSVTSYSIAHRTREFGIRIALGAAPGAIVRSALQALGTAASSGLLIGMISSVALGSLLTRWSIPRMDDPLVLAGVAATLLLSTLGATLVPVRRATSIEPAIALKTD
jgi:ABC-type antimicrobial peptide transport system permease subunit